MHKFMNKWRVQYVKTRSAQVKVMNNYKTLERGKAPNKNTVFDVEDDEWADLNLQYYKLRQIEYEGFNLPIFKQFRYYANAVRNTVEF